MNNDNKLEWCSTCDEYVDKNIALSCSYSDCEMRIEFCNNDLDELNEEHLREEEYVPLNFHTQSRTFMDYVDNEEPEEIEDGESI